MAPNLLAQAGQFLAAEEGKEHSLIFPAVNELIWGTISFAVVFFFLYKYALPRANAALAERTTNIEGKLAQAETDRAEASALLAQYREQLAEARDEASRIRNDAQSERVSIIEEARREAAVAAERVTATERDKLVAERSQIVASLREEVGRLAVDLASKVVGESLADEARQRRTVERFLADVDGIADSATATSGL